MATTETFGKGGAGNVGTHVNHAVESHPADGMHGTSGMAGKGGVGNHTKAAGHYDASGGHDVVDASGRGGAGNIGQHITERDGLGHKRRVSAADKLIGSAQIVLGKITKNADMIAKGEKRKVDGAVAK